MKNLTIIIVVLLSILSNSLFAQSEDKKAPGESFKNLKDGQVLSNPVHIIMEVNGKTVAPAGEVSEQTGHHHLIVDGSFINTDEVVPADEKHFHFGKGQTETDLTLTPGKHKLTLQFANGAHRSYGKAWSKTIEVEVK